MCYQNNEKELLYLYTKSHSPVFTLYVVNEQLKSVAFLLTHTVVLVNIETQKHPQMGFVYRELWILKYLSHLF